MNAVLRQTGTDASVECFLALPKLGALLRVQNPWVFPLRITLKSLPTAAQKYFLSITQSFYAYAQYVEYSPQLRWEVCDLPEIIRAGKKIALEQGKHQLTFTDQFQNA